MWLSSVLPALCKCKVKSVLYQIPTWMQRLYAGVTWRKGVDSVVYLSFDDGPIPEMTPKILRLLKEKNVKATFFVVGDNAAKYPYLMDAIREDGHEVGNHTYHHLAGLKTPTEAYLNDVEACSKLVGRKLMRPPYGRMKFRQKRALLDAGYEIVLWDVLTHDYNKKYSPEKMLQVIDQYIRPGSIIVFHDSLKSGERMLQTLDKAIDLIREKGFRFSCL